RSCRRTRDTRTGPSRLLWLNGGWRRGAPSAELVVPDVGGRQPRFTQEQAQARVDHRGWPRHVRPNVGESALHLLAGHRVHEASLEGEPRIGGGERGGNLLVGEGHRHGEPIRMARAKGLQLVEEEAVPRGAYAEIHVPVTVADMTARDDEGAERPHAGVATT